MEYPRHHRGRFQDEMAPKMGATLKFPSSKPAFTVTEAAEWLCEYREALYGLATYPCKSISQSSGPSAYPTYLKESVTTEQQINDVHVRFSFGQDATDNDYEWLHVPNLVITNGVYDGSLIHHSPGVVHSYDHVAIPVSRPVLPVPIPYIGSGIPRVGPNKFLSHSFGALFLICAVVLLGELWFVFYGSRQQDRSQGQRKNMINLFRSEGRNLSRKVGNSNLRTLPRSVRNPE